MSFHSQYASAIWEDLYNALVPDFVTINRDYIRKFGVPSSGNKQIDKMMSSNVTFVKIPIIKMLEYFENGIDVQIPSRVDMLSIHKSIENYLSEWRQHLKYDINLDRGKHKDLLLGLERLSMLIYGKANAAEVIDPLLLKGTIGLQSPMVRLKEQKELTKPDYSGIGQLLRQGGRGGNNRF